MNLPTAYVVWSVGGFRMVYSGGKGIDGRLCYCARPSRRGTGLNLPSHSCRRVAGRRCRCSPAPSKSPLVTKRSKQLAIQHTELAQRAAWHAEQPRILRFRSLSRHTRPSRSRPRAANAPPMTWWARAAQPSPQTPATWYPRLPRAQSSAAPVRSLGSRKP